MATASGQPAYTFPENFNSAAYFFDPVTAHEELAKRPEARSDKLAFESFMINNVYARQYDFDNNDIYMDWNEIEPYLMKILDTLMSGQNRKNLEVFISRDDESNARMDRFGFLYMHLGILAEVEDEASLAVIMAHEVGHYVFKHVIRGTNDHNILQDYKGDFDLASLDELYRKRRQSESQADSFAFQNALRCGYSLQSTLNEFEKRDMQFKLLKFQASYSTLKRISGMTDSELVKRSNKNSEAWAGHPLEMERYLKCRWANSKSGDVGKKFIVDSVQFEKMRKIAREERKKITFDKCSYKSCARYCFIDYLCEPKKVRNLYMLCESIRRLIYAKPDLAKKGFLAEDIEDKKLFNYNKSILHKPDYIFEDYREHDKLKNHPLLSDEKKPFNTYEEAFLYFSGEALKLNLNESRFGLALHYFAKNRIDSTKKYLDQYSSNGTGLYLDFAKDLLEFGEPRTTNTKTLIVYNNTENYSGLSYNYWYALKRKGKNGDIIDVFNGLNTDHELVFMNELMGNKPARLFEYQKLMHAIFSLYGDNDVGIMAKYYLNSPDTRKGKRLMIRQRKYLLAYAPEWYNWFKTEGYGKLYFTNITYKFDNYFSDDSYEDVYTGFYQDINSFKLGFKDPKRQSKTQTDVEIAKDLLSFLTGK